MTRSDELDAAVDEIEQALTELKAIQKSEVKSRSAIRHVSKTLNSADGRLIRITTGRYA